MHMIYRYQIILLNKQMLELRGGNYLLVYKSLRCLHKVTIQMYTKTNNLPHPLDGIA